MSLPDTTQPERGQDSSGLCHRFTADLFLPKGESPLVCLYFGPPFSFASLRSMSTSWGEMNRKDLCLSSKVSGAESQPAWAAEQRPGCVFTAATGISLRSSSLALMLHEG